MAKTLKIDVKQGILVFIEVALCENSCVSDCVSNIRNDVEKHGGKVAELNFSQCTSLLFIEFDDADNNAKWLEYARKENLI